MAARQRTMSTSAQVAEPEDFQPKLEWAEDAAANVLTIHLPGFTREQIKITYDEKPLKMAIRGERSLGNNIVSRFSTEFPIPENCKLNEMKAKFDQREILTIKMPKKAITPEIAHPKEAELKDQKPQPAAPSSPGTAATDPAKSPTAKPQEEKVSSTPKSTATAAVASAKEPEKKMDEKVTALAPASIPSPSPKAPGLPEPKPQKAETPAKATGQKQADDHVPQPFRPLEDTSRPMPPVSDVQKPRHDQKKTEQDPKPVEQKVEAREKAPKEKDRAKSREPPPQVFERIGKEAVDLATAAKRTVVGLEEERKLLVNAGVAVLVIVAVGAYVGYKLASPSGSHHRNN